MFLAVVVVNVIFKGQRMASMKMLVSGAIADGSKLQALFDELSDTLDGTAFLMGGGYVGDDLLQAAHVKIWRLLPRVKLGSDDVTIRHFLIRAALNAMKDEWRAKRNRRLDHACGNDVDEDIPDRVAIPDWHDHPPAIAAYVDAVETHGSVKKARRAIRRRYSGTSKASRKTQEAQRFARMSSEVRFRANLAKVEDR